MNDLELMHYGVKGQKWGVRRYQNKDGSLTAAGRKRARQEERADNKKAFNLGKQATIYGHAAAQSLRRTINIENKLDKQYAKDPDGLKRRTQALRKKWDASTKSAMQLTTMYNVAREAGEQHCKSLIEKYGNERVAGISYKDIKLPEGKYSPKTFRTMNESTTTISEYAVAAGVTCVSSALMVMGATPIGMVMTPKTTSQKAAAVENVMYNANYKRGT